MTKREVAAHFEALAPERDAWKRRNRYYYADIEKLCAAHIPPGRKVLELGCGTGDLLAAVRPSIGVGVDISRSMLDIAHRKYPGLFFVLADAEVLPFAGPFDYIILSDLLGHLDDIWLAFRELARIAAAHTRILITNHNFFWEPVLTLGEAWGLKMPQHPQNWLSRSDLQNLLYLTDFEIEREGATLLLPKDLPPLPGAWGLWGLNPTRRTVSDWVNHHLAHRQPFCQMALVQYALVKVGQVSPVQSLTCSVLVPCRNEVDSVEEGIRRIPDMGTHTEIIFVDGASTDGTPQKIEELIEQYRGQKDIRLLHQMDRPSVREAEHPQYMLKLGKGDAVRKGFAVAKGDVLMILDADLTVPPEDLPKFYYPLAQGRAEFVNGSRLVYAMEDEAMRNVNLLGNKMFSLIFTWLLGQRIKDTLCGTKALRKQDYERLVAGRSHFGEFDPFGDFDLLFGAARLKLRIADMPVRYRRRTAGYSKVSAFKHGWLLLRMCLIGFWKLRLKKWLRL